jgi:Na+/proline symporter
MVEKNRRIYELVAKILNIAKFIVLFVSLVALAFYLVIEHTWLAAIIFLSLAIIRFIFVVIDHGMKKGLAELLKDVFWRW